MLTKSAEIKLIARCVLNDDRDAFGQLVTAYTPRLKRFLMNLTAGDVYLTDDLAQETFIKAYLNLRAFRGVASFSTWLFRIAYNEFFSYSRRNHDITNEEIPEDSQPVTIGTTSATDAAIDIKVALAALNVTEKAIVTLFYIDDLPLKRIATITGLPEGTVKSHLYRAKTKMQKTLEN